MTPDSLVICQQLLTPAAAPPRTYQPAVVPPWMVARHTRRILLQHVRRAIYTARDPIELDLHDDAVDPAHRVVAVVPGVTTGGPNLPG